MEKRIEKETSRTAEMTCLARACSYFERDPHFKSNDFIAPRLVPAKIKPLLASAPLRHIFMRLLAPGGIYEYVIARTKYIDSIFQQALADHFDQIVIFGAGFDSRAVRFAQQLGATRVFELDAPMTQQAKISQYHKRNIIAPDRLTFVEINFNQDSLAEVLQRAGFEKNKLTLFVMEGLLMYLQRESVDVTFQVIQKLAGAGSLVVFDYVYEAVIRGESQNYGASGITRTAAKAGEEWTFGLEPEQLRPFLSRYGTQLSDQKNSIELENFYFSTPAGHVIARVNGAHCLVTARFG